MYTAPQEWVDYNLMWNHSEYGGVKDLRITPTKLWKPDVLMYNRSVLSFLSIGFISSLLSLLCLCIELIY